MPSLLRIARARLYYCLARNSRQRSRGRI